MNSLSVHYESQELVEQILIETGRQPHLISIVCDALLDEINEQDRVITEKHLEQAWNSKHVDVALSHWEQLPLLERLVLCGGTEQEVFTLEKIQQIFHEHEYVYSSEEIQAALSRLELTFILQFKEKEEYTYCSPLLRKRIQQEFPIFQHNLLIKED